MEEMDRAERNQERFERKIAKRGFRYIGRKMDNMKIWSNENVDFHLDHIGFFHYISGGRVLGQGLFVRILNHRQGPRRPGQRAGRPRGGTDEQTSVFRP